MRNGIILLFLAMIVAGIFAFGGPWVQHPAYTAPYTITALDFAVFLFWMFLMLFLLALLLSPVWRGRRALPLKDKAPQQVKATRRWMTSGFLLAFFFILISFIAAIFGFGFVPSTFAGLAIVVFWIALILTFAAIAIGIFEQRMHRR